MPRKGLSLGPEEEGVFAPKRNLMNPPTPKKTPVIGATDNRQTTFPGQANVANLGAGALRRFNLPGATPVPNVAAPSLAPPVSSTVKPPQLPPKVERMNPNAIANMDPEAWARLQLLFGVEPLGG